MQTLISFTIAVAAFGFLVDELVSAIRERSTGNSGTRPPGSIFRPAA